MKAKTAEYDIGKGCHGRQVTLIYRKSYDGSDEWGIRIDAMNQRDDTQKISGLSLENLWMIGQYVLNREV